MGDAAACPSFLAGQGSALAMVEAYVLAAELARADGDHLRAFARYESGSARCCGPSRTPPWALGLAFAPRSRRQLFVRNTVMRLMGLPLVRRHGPELSATPWSSRRSSRPCPATPSSARRCPAR